MTQPTEGISGPAEVAERPRMTENEWEIVTRILDGYVAGRSVWAFGSRATGRHLKRFSDLDLAVEGTLTWVERAGLSEAFDESLVSFKVEVVELGMVDADFKGRVEKDFVRVRGE
jgi:predicted nucleotidyltransferase